MTIEEARFLERRLKWLKKYVANFPNGILQSELQQVYNDIYPNFEQCFEDDLYQAAVAKLIIPLGAAAKREFVPPDSHRIKSPQRYARP